MKKKLMILGLTAVIGAAMVGTLAGCGGTNPANVTKITAAFTRPTTSGTYGAFNELVANSEGKTIDEAREEGLDFAACVQTSNETGTVIQDVNKNPNSLGYISLGAVAANANLIKAIKVNDVEPTVDNIKSGDYKLARPFNFVYNTQKGLSDLAQNFIDFINSTEGQELVGEDYIGVAENPVEYVPYAGTETTLTLTGSTSVQPLMNDFIVPAFKAANPGKNFTINVSGSGSGQGESDAVDGKNDLGMISREMKSSYDGTLTSVTIAQDGIAIIVHKDVNITNVSFDEIYNLYMNGTPIDCD